MADVWIQIEGHNEQEKAEWERTRVVAYTMYLSIPEKGRKKKMQQFMPFTWEKGARGKDPHEIMRQHEELRKLRESKPEAI